MKFDQAEFFDHTPVVYPCPLLLRRGGLRWVYKPRDAEFANWIDQLGLKKGDRVLEVGCGDGIFLDRVTMTYGVRGTGLDLSSRSIDRARKQALSPIRFVIGEATQLPFRDNIFEVVMSFDVLEHIGRPGKGKGLNTEQRKALQEMVRVVRPGGKVLIYTLNLHQRWTWNWWLSKLGVDVYIRWAHDPRLFLEMKKTAEELESKGMVIERVEYFNAFFSLIVDELVMMITVLLTKMSWLKRRSAKECRGGRILIPLLSFFSRVTRPVFWVLEWPWSARGLSNSFFVLARKK
jgi:ubiquinone/menaquinone biosynthesis C-methylase UbiE